MSFCPRCDNLLYELTTGNNLEFSCPTCLEKYQANPTATLLMSDNVGEDSASKFRKFIKNSAFDPTNIKVKDECSKCKSKVATHIRVTDQEKVLHTCRCGNIWVPDYSNKVKGGSIPLSASLSDFRPQIENIVNDFIKENGGSDKSIEKIWNLVTAEVTDDDFFEGIKSVMPRDNSKQINPRVKEILPWLKKFSNKINYLDIGCSEAGMTEAVASALKLNKRGQVYGTDVKIEPCFSKNINFIVSTHADIPLPDNKFDLITAFMAFHHFIYLQDMITEISRMLKPGGTLIIREHDNNDTGFSAFLDLVHLVYAAKIGGKELMPGPAHYKSREEWTRELEKFDFNHYDYIDSNDILKSYYGLYVKKT